VFFVIEAPADEYDGLKGKLSSYPAFFYFVEAPKMKLVAKREGYEFTFAAFDNERAMAAFIT